MAELPSILLASSEVIGFAKTGGLADVCGYLPQALRRRGHPVAVIMPLYRSVRLGRVPIFPTEHVLTVPVGKAIVPTRLWRGTIPGSDAPVRSRTKPDIANSGSIDSIIENTASYSATSTTCPLPVLCR